MPCGGHPADNGLYLKQAEGKMGKKVYTINGNPYIIDDETGKIKTVQIKDEQVPQRDLDELIKILMQEAKDNK
jgi:hypothetical protein